MYMMVLYFYYIMMVYSRKVKDEIKIVLRLQIKRTSTAQCNIDFSTAHKATFSSYSIKKAKGQLLWIQHSSMFTANCSRLRCLCSQWICHKRNLSGWRITGNLSSDEKERRGTYVLTFTFNFYIFLWREGGIFKIILFFCHYKKKVTFYHLISSVLLLAD